MSIGTSNTRFRFAVIGAGRLGASLALALAAHGATLAGFTANTPAGRARAEEWLGSPAALHIDDLVSLRPDTWFITVPDQALPSVAHELGDALAGSVAGSGDPPAETPLPTVAHTSGATSVAVLDPCAAAGAATLVFHPLQTFSDPHTGCRRFDGAAIAITPCSPGQAGALRSETAKDLGFSIAALLGGRPFLLADGERSLYHAAATVACNYLVTLEHCAEQLFIRAGLPTPEALSYFFPLVRATLDNIGAQGPVKALTGPLSRGDVETIASHLDALSREAPHLLSLYKALGVATLDLVRAMGHVDPGVLGELAILLEAPAAPSSSHDSV